jgi:hypothetical protein
MVPSLGLGVIPMKRSRRGGRETLPQFRVPPEVEEMPHDPSLMEELFIAVGKAAANCLDLDITISQSLAAATCPPEVPKPISATSSSKRCPQPLAEIDFGAAVGHGGVAAIADMRRSPASNRI